MAKIYETGEYYFGFQINWNISCGQLAIPINEFTGNGVNGPIREREEIQLSNVSSSLSQVDIPSSSQATPGEIDISDHSMTSSNSIHQIDVSEEPSTSTVTTHTTTDSQTAAATISASNPMFSLRTKEPPGEISVLPAISQATSQCTSFPTNSVITSEMGALFFKKPELHATGKSPQKIINVRLKQRTYGEVLTTEDVLQRLKDAEQKKNLKRKGVKSQKKEIKPIKEKKKKRKGGIPPSAQNV